MATRLTFKGSELNFPKVCLVCQQPSEKTYNVSRTFSYGNRSVTLTLPMPLCPKHFDLASQKNPTERLIGQVGLVLGIVAGLAVVAGLLAYWSSTQQGNLAMNVLLAAFVGVGAWLIVWVGLAFFVAPMFGDPASKAVRTTMKIFHYWPGSKDIALEFASEAAANAVAAANGDRLLKRE